MMLVCSEHLSDVTMIGEAFTSISSRITGRSILVMIIADIYSVSVLICVVGLHAACRWCCVRTQSIDTVCLDATLVSMTLGFLDFFFVILCRAVFFMKTTML